LNLTESVDIIANEKLVAEPGQRFNYGGANYQVAARIAEVVGGQPFDHLMQTQLLNSLNLAATYFRPDPAQNLSKVATTYSFVAGKGLVPINAYRPDPNRRLILASGGLYSSLNDLAVFLQMHLNDGVYGSARILTPAAVAEMQKVQTADTKVRYGLGWFIDRSAGLGDAQSISHPGLFGSMIWIDKDRELIGVFLTTSLWPGFKPLNDELRKMVLDLFPVGS
jgi:CubicO group peptidase (beta-lactamase class C family)